jgi:hypothetical protein
LIGVSHTTPPAVRGKAAEPTAGGPLSQSSETLTCVGERWADVRYRVKCRCGTERNLGTREAQERWVEWSRKEAVRG